MHETPLFHSNLGLSLDRCPLLLDTSLLTGQTTQVIQFGTTYLTALVDLDAVDVG